MDYNVITIGKIREIDYSKGVGEIVTVDKIYQFTVNDSSSFNDLKKGDLVRFRGEKVNNIDKAFFVDVVGPDYNFSREDHIALAKEWK